LLATPGIYRRPLLCRLHREPPMGPAAAVPTAHPCQIERARPEPHGRFRWREGAALPS